MIAVQNRAENEKYCTKKTPQTFNLLFISPSFISYVCGAFCIKKLDSYFHTSSSTIYPFGSKFNWWSLCTYCANTVTTKQPSLSFTIIHLIQFCCRHPHKVAAPVKYRVIKALVLQRGLLYPCLRLCCYMGYAAVLEHFRCDLITGLDLP